MERNIDLIFLSMNQLILTVTTKWFTSKSSMSLGTGTPMIIVLVTNHDFDAGGQEFCDRY
jgi:hypothetical protein